jgi:glyoxylase-like metal-dependent hydrolase (beta-lactamase superfamily II)
MNVHAIQTGTVRVRARQRAGVGRAQQRRLRTMLNREWTEPLPIFAWVIEHPEGLILVDTGETAKAMEPGWFPRWHPYFRLAVRLEVAAEDEIGPQLERLGFAPDDVRWIVLTHLHTDHAGGLHHFPRSEVLIARAEFEAASGFAGKVRGFLPHRLPAWLAPRLLDLPAEPFGPFSHSMALTDAGDVRIVGTPGHTPGHQSVILEDGDSTIFFAGDTSYTEALMVGRRIDGVASDDQAARETLRRINVLAAERRLVYLPAHDAEAAARLAERRPVAA